MPSPGELQSSPRDAGRAALPARPMVQTLAIAALVATLLWLPVSAALALLCAVVLGISFHAFVTFGGNLSPAAGLLTWWALALLPATVYARLLKQSPAKLRT
jgi:hypothetical protein